MLLPGAPKTTSGPVGGTSTRSTFNSLSTSSIAGPFINGQVYYWKRDALVTPTTVGTVVVQINDATNQTTTTTIFHSEYKVNGTLRLLTRNNTNPAGTVTQVVSSLNATLLVLVLASSVVHS